MQLVKKAMRLEGDKRLKALEAMEFSLYAVMAGKDTKKILDGIHSRLNRKED
jgi:hypothetical protein